MKKRIICYGDSNTWGYCAGTGERFDENTRWTGILQNKLGDSYVVLEEGLSGRTTTFDVGFDDYNNGKDALGFVLKTHAPLDAAVIFLGTNDLVDRSMARSAKGIEEIIRRFKNANEIIRSSIPIFPKGPKILVISPIAYGKGRQLSEEKNEETKQFPIVYGQVAEKMGVEFLDPSSFVTASEIDGVHLTEDSHKKLGNAVFEKLKEMGL